MRKDSVTVLLSKLVGEMKQVYGCAIGNPMTVRSGRRQVLAAKLRRHCGYSHTHAQQVVDAWDRSKRSSPVLRWRSVRRKFFRLSRNVRH